MAGNESDSWDDYPWLMAEHRPPPKHLRKRKKEKRDLNQGKVPTAYMIRLADDGTKWHSVIDILRPNSPPVEWPEYPDRPVEDDFPLGFNWDAVSDFDEDPGKELKKLGIPESDYKDHSNKKSTKKILEKIKKLKKEIMDSCNPDLEPEVAPPCSSSFVPEIPELIDDDHLYSDKDGVETYLPKGTGYGGGVTESLGEDDYYPRDNDEPFKSTKGFGHFSVTTPKDFPRQQTKNDFEELDEDSGEVSTGLDDGDRLKVWRELQEL